MGRCLTLIARRAIYEIEMNSKKNQAGFSLLEVLVSLAILGTIGVTFLTGLSGISTSTQRIDDRQVAKNLAENQMEYLKGQAYAASYTPAPIPAEDTGFTAVIDISPMQDGNIQKITVSIQHQTKLILKMEGYKTR